MKRCRRILAVVLAICMVLGLVYMPGHTKTAYAAVSGDYEYEELSATTVKITKYTGSDAELEIPNQIDGKTVTEIGAAAFKGNGSLEKIVVPNGVEYLRDEAFRTCINLSAVGLPQSIKQFDSYVFDGCSSLKNVYYAGTQSQWGQIHTVLPENAILLNININYDSELELSGTGKDFNYEPLSDGTVQITEYTGKDTIVSIPEKIDGKIVSSVGETTFISNDGITKVIISPNINNIDAQAFTSCLKLVEINVDKNNLNYYSDEGILYSKDKTELIRCPAGKSGTCSVLADTETIGRSAFGNCKQLTEIEFPTGLVNIGEAAFTFCDALTEISLPSGLRYIEDYAFSGCFGLTEVTLSGNVERVNGSSFYSCENLEAIHVDNSNPYYSSWDGVLYSKDKTELIKVPDSVADSFEIPSGVEDIGGWAFNNCMKLTEVTIPSGVARIGKSAFSYCSYLTEVTISSDVKEIEESAFEFCVGLKNVFYSGTEEQWNNIQIGPNNEALQDAEIYCEEDPEDDFENRDLDDGTVEITRYNGSETVVLIPEELDGKSVTQLGSKVFEENNNIEEVWIPASVKNITGDVFNSCLSLTAIYADEESESLLSDEGILFNKKKTEIVRYPTTKSGSYTIPDSVTNIGSDAFYGCTGLTEINIPSSVNKIEWAAFCNCTGLKKISIPASVTNIEGSVFCGCINMTEAIIPDSVLSIGDGAFAGCEGLTEINIPAGLTDIADDLFSSCTGLTQISIPNKVKSIKSLAFSDCKGLRKIDIPVSVTIIEDSAFELCNNLSEVFYAGTKEQWESIHIEASNEPLLNAAIYYNGSQPEPEEPILPVTVDAKEELERLKSGDPFALNQDFQHYLSEEQIDILESYLYTWLAEINYVYQYSGSDGVKERIMKKAGIDPQGDFASGKEQAITHICVETKYGAKTFEVMLDLGKPDNSGNLYPAYGAMHYEILEKGNIPSDLPDSGQIGRDSYEDLGTFAQCVKKTSEDALRNIYQWESLSDEMTSGVLVDKTVTEIIGNKNGSFSDATFTIYAKPLFTYSKKVTIACPVDVYIYSMDGSEAGSIINNKPNGGSANVRLDVNGDTKTVYLTGNDYYLNLRGTDTGTMRYEVEEIANEEVRRNVQFLELQLQKDMQYEGYVFRPLNIDSDLYALRTKGDIGQEVFYADADTYKALFRRIQGLSLSQGQTSLERNKTIQLNASMVPLDASNPDLQWSTDNESVVKVDEHGLVTAVSAGKATVTVSTKDGSFLKQYCVIDVADKANGTGGSSSSGSSGWYGGAASAPVEQDKNPVVVNLHYVLQFQTNGGTNLSRKTMTLLADDSPGIMPKVQRKDYLFDGWYTKQDGGEKITGEKPLKEAATLYARWTRVSAPAKSAVSALKSKKKGQMQVSFQNINAVSGYQMEYALNKKFTGVKIKESGKAAKSKTISGLKPGKKYYVRVRAYQLDSMKNRIYGAYSTVKSVKVQS